MEKNIIWEGRPSQVANLMSYFICLLTCWLVLPLFLAWRKYNKIKQTIYAVKKDAVTISHPESSKYNRLLELYRIKDILIEQPAFYRFFSLHNVIIYPNDDYTPPVVFKAVEFPEELKEHILKRAEEIRNKKQIREIQLPILQ